LISKPLSRRWLKTTEGLGLCDQPEGDNTRGWMRQHEGLDNGVARR
jgi:hypothetical protein